MTTPQQWDNLIGLTATDADGDKIGKVGQVYLDEGTGKPEWVTVSTGMFGTRESFAPLYSASVRDDQLVLAVPRQLVKDAPNYRRRRPPGRAPRSGAVSALRRAPGSGRPGPRGDAGDDRYSGRHAAKT